MEQTIGMSPEHLFPTSGTQGGGRPRHKIQRSPTLATCYRPRPACKIIERQAEAEEGHYGPEDVMHRREGAVADLPAVNVKGIAVKGIAAGGVALRALATGAFAAGAAAIGAFAIGDGRGSSKSRQRRS
ncbi:MAG TPA: hypothetical protein VI094_08995 [Propionibacteriaceae bacterium]